MALVIDPDNLNQSTLAASGAADGEVFLNTTNKTIELISTTDGTPAFAASNIIAADGVTLQALYSFLKEQWKTDANLIKYPFPMEAITSEQFEFINGWKLNDATTASRTYVRFGGWSEKDAAGDVGRQYMSVITLGTFVLPASQKAYYSWAGDVAKTDFTYSGPVNEAVQIYGDIAVDATTTTFDNRATVLTVRIRPDTTGASGSVVGYTFDQSTTTDIGASTVTYQAYRFPLASVVDLNLSLTDAEIVTLISTKTFAITWYASQQNSSTFLSPDLNGGPFLYSIVIDNATNNATPSEVYNYVQGELRKTSDIDNGAGTEYGVLTDEMVVFVGSVLQSYDIDVSGVLGGVLVGSIDTNDAANFKFTDDGGTLRVFPAISAGSIVANANLINDPSSKYWMFFDNANGNLYPSANAILVDNYAGVDITGQLHSTVTSPATGNQTDTNGAVTAAGFVLTSAAAGWTVSDFVGKVLKVSMSGGDVYAFITANDATTITVGIAFEATESTLTFEIFDKNTAGTIVWDFDYTNNVQGGRTGGTDAAISIVASGLGTGQYVLASGNTIINGSGQNFSVTAALERNYSDPT